MDVTIVEAQSDLDDAAAVARNASEIALDTEFMREKTYRARLCLVQIATQDDIFLINPDELDLRRVAELIAEPDVEVVVHAGGQDLAIFYERFEVVPARVFDVQLAAGFAGYGASLPYGRVVSSLLGVQLQKGESYTDWCRRPLTDAQKRYAADDVRYLLDAKRKLESDLERLGRTAWVAEEMRAMSSPETYVFDPGSAWKKVAGRGTLNPKQLTILRELAAWREETAAQRDLPRGWVIKDATLIDIARRAPRDLRQLKDVRGMNAREVDRAGVQILAAVRAGASAPPMEQRDPLPRSAQIRARMLAGLADAIVRARAEGAEIATELVATRGELEALLGEVVANKLVEGNHRLLTGWRRELAGDAVVALARGQIAVRAIDRPPYVEEVQL